MVGWGAVVGQNAKFLAISQSHGDIIRIGRRFNPDRTEFGGHAGCHDHRPSPVRKDYVRSPSSASSLLWMMTPFFGLAIAWSLQFQLTKVALQGSEVPILSPRPIHFFHSFLGKLKVI